MNLFVDWLGFFGRFSHAKQQQEPSRALERFLFFSIHKQFFSETLSRRAGKTSLLVLFAARKPLFVPIIQKRVQREEVEGELMLCNKNISLRLLLGEGAARSATKNPSQSLVEI
jgi:hypothetical protein